jgi:hypothetical protein
MLDPSAGRVAGAATAKESCSFLKKRAKKLLPVGTRSGLRNGPRKPTSKSLLLLFFKKEGLPSFPVRPSARRTV